MRWKCLSCGRSLSFYLSIRRAIKEIVVILGAFTLPTTYEILSNILLSRLTTYAEEIIGNHQCDFNATGQLLIIYCAFVKYLRKMGIQRSSESAVYRLQESL
jgi:hypothetical protein